ncbi:uncharacterized protein LOC133557619 isoform X2 [Nerophis ophidion]|uniref:uncharacterized protein LOC133557619 isoform X2 n=1 Tax=Nerophis ophidion TaxID=159077 RepID=UPI002AE0826D|nr:uncharacterized protein LOC133557619 isoform X2 [Nerophis ophidion]XP_061764243.1 uncharacterized protein LOC133557619 isoform X2 [Nerophis ophidion]
MDPRNTSTVFQTHIDYIAASAPSSFDSNDAETLHSGGERSKSDPQLTRKKIMLRHTEEHIFGKKAAIAPKKMKLSEKEQPGPDCVASTLRNRVNTFLQQQQCPSVVLKCNMFKPPVAREAPIRRSDQELLEDHHPLKRRVKALLKHTNGHPNVFVSNHPVPDHTAIRPLAAQLFPRPSPIATPPASSSVASPDQKESDANKGFERFLSLLNSGVNIELLSKIVNDDSEDLHSEDGSMNIKPNDVKGVLDVPIGSENHECNNYSLIPEGTERSTYEQSSCETHSLSYDNKNRKDRQKCSLSLSDRSEFPPTIKNKKEKEKPAEVDARCELLQNILNTLGLSLETEELSKLTDRTEERLYGKRNERSPVATSIVEHDSTSSSYSPSRMQLSNSRNSMDHHREKSFSECSDSKKSREELSLFSYQDDAPVQRIAGNNQDLQTFEETHHAHSSQECNTVSSYSLPEHSQFNASFNGENSSCWTPAHGSQSIFPFPYSLYTDHSHPTIASADSELSHIYHSQEHVDMNPDLFLSECQFRSKKRCLKTVKHRPKKKKRINDKPQMAIISKERILKQIKVTSDFTKMMMPQHGTKHQEVDHPKKEKQPPTEEEIKAKLKKKLEEFNQKNKPHTIPKS